MPYRYGNVIYVSMPYVNDRHDTPASLARDCADDRQAERLDIFAAAQHRVEVVRQKRQPDPGEQPQADLISAPKRSVSGGGAGVTGVMPRMVTVAGSPPNCGK